MLNHDNWIQRVELKGEDELELQGYKENKTKAALIYVLYVATLGLARLFFHWYPNFLLTCTHSRCNLDEADAILAVDIYKGKWKTFFVEKVHTLSSKTDDSGGGGKLSFYTEGSCLIKEAAQIRTFTCKNVNYVWDDVKRVFVRLGGLQDGVKQVNLHENVGLNAREQNLRRIVYGLNEIDVPLNGIFKLFILEALTPFYIFQVFTLIVWFFEEYYYYGIAIILMSAFGIGTTIIQTRTNQLNLRAKVHVVEQVTIKTSAGEYIDVPSTSLVPGDVMVIPNHGCVMHCDVILLNGSCVLNESMLTGESVPVIKTALPKNDKSFETKDGNSHVLYCGTKVIQTRTQSDEKVLSLVMRTGFLTSKGELVRSIMYPPPADFKFDRDSYKFIAILAVVSVVGVIYTAVSKSSRHLNVVDIILKALDTITILIPPALPAAMTVGKLYAATRLKKNNIFCINSRVINVSGSVNCVCFDKTGTLTEDGLDMWGIVPVADAQLQQPIEDVKILANSSKLIQGMSSCHSLTLIANQLEGDPLDVKMFEATGWKLEEIGGITTVTHSDASLEIIHQNQFASNLQRMSVVTQTPGSQSFRLFCKGSPEMITSLSQPQSVPPRIKEDLKTYTEKGYRVIAMATRLLDAQDVEHVRKLKREDCEDELEFLGLIILENKVKPDTGRVIDNLRRANMKVVMITGDNIETAVSVAKECGIIEGGATLVEVDARAPTKTEDAKIIYDVTKDMNFVNKHDFCEELELEKGCGGGEKFHFVMSGTTWGVITKYFPKDVAKFVSRGSIFARMSSDQKQHLVEELQALGYYVCMCGDGTNDCGALRAAHVGISLSEAESSVASPFTSQNPHISCVEEVIKQGRAALVTSFGIFKLMLAYSLTEYTSVMILYSIDCNLSNLQFLYIDIFLVLIFAALFGKTEAYDGKLFPRPPMTSLVSLVPIISLSLFITSAAIFQVLAYNFIQTFDWFVPYKYANENYYVAYENYAVCGVSFFQYIAMAVIFSQGAPYRKSIFSNRFFIGYLIFKTIFCAYLILEPADWLATFLDLKIPPRYDGKTLILLLAFANFLLAYVLEDFVVNYLIYKKILPKFKNIERSSKKFLQVEMEMQNDSRWKFTRKFMLNEYDNVAFLNDNDNGVTLIHP